MNKETKPLEGGEQPSEETKVVDENVTPAKEETVDENEDLSEFGVPPIPTEEDFEEKKEAEKTETEKTETEKEEKVPEKDVESPEEAPVQPGRLDRRIAKLYISNRLLQGEEGDLPDLEQVALEIQKYPLEEKTKALHRLLAENKAVRSGGVKKDQAAHKFPNFPWNRDDSQETVDLSEEDHEAIVEAEAERKMQEMQSEISDREFTEDLVKTLDAHPEINERNKKEYNPQIANAVEKLALPYGQDGPRGMRVSAAYKLVMDSIVAARGKEASEQKTDEEINKQRALSGAVSASNDSSNSSKKMTWVEFDKLRTSDPARYEKLLDEGYEPSEEE